MNSNQTITSTSQCTWFFEEEWILLIIFEILFRIIFVIYSLIEAQLGSILEYLFNFMVNILKPWVKFCCSAKLTLGYMLSRLHDKRFCVVLETRKADEH